MNDGNLYAPLPRCGAREGNSNGRIVHHRLVRLAMKLVVAQFCRAKDHEIINEGTVCERSEKAMQFLHRHQLDTVVDSGGVRGVQMHPPFEELPSRVLSLRTLRPTLTIVEYHKKLANDPMTQYLYLSAPQSND